VYDPRDSRGVPVSGGIPIIVRIAAVVGLIVIFIMFAIVTKEAQYGHVWPSVDAAKIKL
jgi:ABC-type multidrug transport system permease subunit